MDANLLFWGVMFSIVGMVYFSYGRKQNLYFFITGIILLVFPYVMSSLLWLIIIGLILSLLPFFLNWRFPL